MAAALAKYWSLGVLRVYLDQSQLVPAVTCKVVVHEDGSEREALSETFPVTDFDSNQLPSRLVTAVTDWVKSGADDQSILWLHLVRPYGNLGRIAWELLQTATGIPVLRLPNVLPKLHPPTGRLDVAVCISSPQMKGALPTVHYAAEIFNELSILDPPPRVHFFVDHHEREPVRDALGGLADTGDRWLVHDWAKSAAAESSEAVRDANPWADWIIRTSYQGNFDLVHFVCHGYQSVSKDTAVLSLASSPAEGDFRYASHLPPSRIRKLLDAVGAYGALFTSPQQNYSVAATRMVADAVGVSRAGPVVMHDAELGQDSPLALAYHLMLGGKDYQYEALPGLMLYIQPEIVLGDQDEAAPQEDYGIGVQQPSIAASAPRALNKWMGTRDDSPTAANDAGWTAVMARYVDSKQVELADFIRNAGDGDLSPSQEAYVRGLQSAVEQLNSLIDAQSGA